MAHGFDTNKANDKYACQKSFAKGLLMAIYIIGIGVMIFLSYHMTKDSVDNLVKNVNVE